jgi:hypothetical protein
MKKDCVDVEWKWNKNFVEEWMWNGMKPNSSGGGVEMEFNFYNIWFSSVHY